MRFVVIALLMLIAACDGGPDVPTAAQNSDLDDAAGHLDNASAHLDGIDANALDDLDTTRAAPEGTAPSGSADRDPSEGSR